MDGVLCRYAYMLVADPAAAFAETRRVLRPGGRVVLAVWGAPERNPFFAALGMSLVRAGHVPPDPTAPGPFSLSDPERVRGLLMGAGFADVRTEEVTTHFTFPDVDECVAIHATPRGRWRSCSGVCRRPSAPGSPSPSASPSRRSGTGAGYEVPRRDWWLRSPPSPAPRGAAAR